MAGAHGGAFGDVGDAHVREAAFGDQLRGGGDDEPLSGLALGPTFGHGRLSCALAESTVSGPLSRTWCEWSE